MPVGVYKRSKEQLKRLAELSRQPRTLRGGGYQAIHMWLNKNFGKANKCENKNCPKTSKKYHHALRKGFKHEHKRENYIMFCAKCHFDYDITNDRRKKQANSLRGYKQSKEHKLRISKSMKGKNKGKNNGMWRGGKYAT